MYFLTYCLFEPFLHRFNPKHILGLEAYLGTCMNKNYIRAKKKMQGMHKVGRKGKRGKKFYKKNGGDKRMKVGWKEGKTVLNICCDLCN